MIFFVISVLAGVFTVLAPCILPLLPIVIGASEENSSGVSRKAFDRRGNYSLGIKDHTIFPEVDTSTLVKIRSLQVVINTSAKTNEEGLALLEALGMPFERLKIKSKQA